jgi:hypothetical protein
MRGFTKQMHRIDLAWDDRWLGIVAYRGGRRGKRSRAVEIVGCRSQNKGAMKAVGRLGIAVGGIYTAIPQELVQEYVDGSVIFYSDQRHGSIICLMF